MRALSSMNSSTRRAVMAILPFEHRARHSRVRRRPAGKDRRHEDCDADRLSRHPRHHRGRRCSRQHRGWRGRGQNQALSGCRWACWPDRGIQPAGRAARHADARVQRICDPLGPRWAVRRGTVSDSAARGGA